MNDSKYIIDANVLSSKTVVSSKNTPFFKNNCIVIDEIAYELEFTSHGPDIKKVKEDVRAGVLKVLPEIVDELIDHKILELDKGNGDALLIATALYIKEGRDETQGTLAFAAENPIIVTEEKAIRNYCLDKKIDCINLSDFTAILNVAV